LNEASFEETALKGLDFSQSMFEVLHIDLKQVQGCKIAPAQAVLFAMMLGIEIRD